MSKVIVITHRWPLLMEGEMTHKVIENAGHIKDIPAPAGAFFYSNGNWWHRSTQQQNYKKVVTTTSIPESRVPAAIKAWVLILS